jgi:DNA-binding transcriptional regulator of glucitol operon
MSRPDVSPEPEGVPHVTHAPVSRSRGIWWTKRAVGMHVTLLVAVPAFLALFWWQVDRVRQGNTLSWAYVFEWPFFTCYAVYLWWKLVHDQGESARPPSTGTFVEKGTTGRRRDVATDDPDTHGEELAAYNRYLAELHASARPKRW